MRWCCTCVWVRCRGASAALVSCLHGGPWIRQEPPRRGGGANSPWRGEGGEPRPVMLSHEPASTQPMVLPPTSPPPLQLHYYTFFLRPPSTPLHSLSSTSPPPTPPPPPPPPRPLLPQSQPPQLMIANQKYALQR